MNIGWQRCDSGVAGKAPSDFVQEGSSGGGGKSKGLRFFLWGCGCLGGAFIIGVLLIMVLGFRGCSRVTDHFVQMVERTHMAGASFGVLKPLLDAGNLDAVYEAMSPTYRKMTSKEDFLKRLDSVKDHLKGNYVWQAPVQWVSDPDVYAVNFVFVDGLETFITLTFECVLITPPGDNVAAEGREGASSCEMSFLQQKKEQRELSSQAEIEFAFQFLNEVQMRSPDVLYSMSRYGASRENGFTKEAFRTFATEINEKVKGKELEVINRRYDSRFKDGEVGPITIEFAEKGAEQPYVTLMVSGNVGSDLSLSFLRLVPPSP